MSIRRWSLGSLAALALAGGCAGHNMVRGSVVAVSQPETAQVAVHGGNLQVGEQVRLYHETCAHNRSRQGNYSCHRAYAGEGRVVQLMGSDATVQFSNGVPVQQGDVVAPASASQ